MSPASYLAAPPRVAAEIVAPALRSARGLDDLQRPHRRVSRYRRRGGPALRPRAGDVAVLRAAARPPRRRAPAPRPELGAGFGRRRAGPRPDTAEREPCPPPPLPHP